MADVDNDDIEKNGGSAFPTADYFPGMTLRDWFAGQALNGALSNPECRDMPLNELAVWSYHTADAMLKARQS